MRRCFATLTALIVLVSLTVPAVALAAQGPLPDADLLSIALVENPEKYDGTQVTYEGEAIGEAMRRGDMVWLHVNDDAYSRMAVDEGALLSGFNSGHAIWLPAAEAGKVRTFGDNKHRGDLVRVEGTFNAACPEHGGDMDIHATSLQVVSRGAVVGDPIRQGKAAWAVALAAVAVLLYLLSRLWDRLFPDKVSPFA